MIRVIQLSIVRRDYFGKTGEEITAMLDKHAEAHRAKMGANQWSADEQIVNPFPDWVQRIIERLGVKRTWDNENECYMIEIETEPSMWARFRQWLRGEYANGDLDRVTRWFADELVAESARCVGYERREWVKNNHIHVGIGFEQEAAALKEVDEFYAGKSPKPAGAANDGGDACACR